MSLASQVLQFADLIQYQSGSIVSKVIVKQKGGNVTLFAFDAGQELSEHTAPFDALVQVLGGEATIMIAGQAFEVKANQSILMPANIPHALKATKAFKMLLTMVRGE